MNDAPGRRSPEDHEPSAAATEWIWVSSSRHVTVPPARTPTLVGTKARPSTNTGDGFLGRGERAASPHAGSDVAAHGVGSRTAPGSGPVRPGPPIIPGPISSSPVAPSRSKSPPVDPEPGGCASPAGPATTTTAGSRSATRTAAPAIIASTPRTTSPPPSATTQVGLIVRLTPPPLVDGGRAALLLAPAWGALELWRLDLGSGDVERLTTGEHAISSIDAVATPAGGTRIASVRASATDLAEIWVGELGATGKSTRRKEAPTPPDRRLALVPATVLNAAAVADIARSAPVERRWEVDGRTIQGWWYPPLAPDGSALATPAPLVVQIHGGPMTYYGHAPFWEWQVLAGAGIGVLACNPRGSDGYGQAFAGANFRDWGDGPTADVLAGVDLLVAEGAADPARLGVTGGSYGGYLTSWIVGHDDRFAAAITCRSVNDLALLMGTGDIAGPEFGREFYGAQPWEDPDIYRSQSPLTYASRIRTPLLIQHAEQDLRTTIAQAELLFTALRSLRRQVRLMRVPAYSTSSPDPGRRSGASRTWRRSATGSRTTS